MQLDPELTLSKALVMACQTEAIRQQQPRTRGILQQDCPSVKEIDNLRYNPKNAKRLRWDDRERSPKSNAGGDC